MASEIEKDIELETGHVLFRHRRLFQAVAKTSSGGAIEQLNDGAEIILPVAKIHGRVTATTVTEFNPAGDRLHLEQMEVDVRIGVTDEERANPQPLVLSLTIWPNAEFGRLCDDITRTINYVELCRTTREFAQSHEWKLIETLSAELAAHLIREFPLGAAEVEVRKFVLPKTKYVSATAHRSASTR